MKISSNKFFFGIAPLLCVVVLYIGMPYIQQLPLKIIDNVPYTPYIFLTGAIFMGIFFKRHRVTLVAACLTVVYLVSHNAYTASELTSQHLVILAMLGILLPVNILILSRTQDHQTLSIQALVASAVILIQVIVCYWLAKNYFHPLEEWLLLTPQTLENLLPKTTPPAVIISYATCTLWMATHISKKGYIFEFTFIGVLAASFFSFQASHLLANSTFMLLASLILIWGLVYNSHLIAYIDELTELPGRRAMNEEMASLRGDYTVAMLDIDHFKKFNDSYGHDVGDQVLRMVANKIAKIRGNGKPFRYGGEEFAILFLGKDSKTSFPYLSNLRETIDSARMILRDQNRPNTSSDNAPPRKASWQEVHVTISIGVANNCDELTTTADVLKAADDALYRSKEKGRNRISQYSTNNYDPDLGSSAVE